MTWDELRETYQLVFGARNTDWRLDFFRLLHEEGFLSHFHLKPVVDGQSRTRFDLLLYVLLREGHYSTGEKKEWIRPERIKVLVSPAIDGVFAGAELQEFYSNGNPAQDMWKERSIRRNYVESSAPEPVVEWFKRLPISWLALPEGVFVPEGV